MRVFSLFACVLALSFSPPAFAQEISGTPAVVDGDTLDFAGTWIDLNGVDAPELPQTCQRRGEPWECGEEAASFLREFVARQTIHCRPRLASADGVVIADCSRGSLDLSAIMIEAGLALARDNAPDGYRQAEALRQQHKMGLWASEFEAPAQWRAANPSYRVAPPAPSVAEGVSSGPNGPTRADDLNRQWRNKFGCAIKGNRNRRGQWIYHLPGYPYYAQTRAEELFCTEAEARAAGYRRSKA